MSGECVNKTLHNLLASFCKNHLSEPNDLKPTCSWSCATWFPSCNSTTPVPISLNQRMSYNSGDYKQAWSKSRSHCSGCLNYSCTQVLYKLDKKSFCVSKTFCFKGVQSQVVVFFLRPTIVCAPVLRATRPYERCDLKVHTHHSKLFGGHQMQSPEAAGWGLVG